MRTVVVSDFSIFSVVLSSPSSYGHCEQGSCLMMHCVCCVFSCLNQTATITGREEIVTTVV